MKSSPVTLAGVALVVLLTACGGARAELIPWMYNWSRSPSVIHADAPGTGYITLTDESLESAVGNSNIVATNLRTYSTADIDHPDVFTNKVYTLYLALYDTESHLGGTMAFTGLLNGTLTALSSNITNTFTGMTTQQLVLGSHLYRATIGPYTPPGPTGSHNSGSISATVKITVVTLPEPGSLALSGLGLALLGLRRWRRSRRE